jgi:hypothetical protein
MLTKCPIDVRRPGFLMICTSLPLYLVNRKRAVRSPFNEIHQPPQTLYPMLPRNAAYRPPRLEHNQNETRCTAKTDCLRMLRVQPIEHYGCSNEKRLRTSVKPKSTAAKMLNMVDSPEAQSQRRVQIILAPGCIPNRVTHHCYLRGK